MMRRFSPDVVHETFFSKRPSAPGAPAHVLTVFDMISELLALDTPTPETALRKTAKYAAVARADHVICISDYTRLELIRLFDIPAHKISVVHLGCDSPSGDPGEYFDPERPDSIAPAIERIVFSQERTDELIELGRMRAALFTWKRCADETLGVYRSLAPGAAGSQPAGAPT